MLRTDRLTLSWHMKPHMVVLEDLLLLVSGEARVLVLVSRGCLKVPKYRPLRVATFPRTPATGPADGLDLVTLQFPSPACLAAQGQFYSAIDLQERARIPARERTHPASQRWSINV